MSTNDVPGHDPKNNDILAMGCWAEHSDGSLIFVESTEDRRVIYSIFDMAKDPIVEYRDSMPEVNFKNQFSWKPSGSGITREKWTWHDKTAFPWNRVIKNGARDGLRYASADAVKTAAERVGESLHLRAREYDDRHADQVDEELLRTGIFARLETAINGLPAAVASAVSGLLPQPTKAKRKK